MAFANSKVNTKKIEAIKKALDAHTKAKPEAEAALLEAQTKLAAAEKTETTSSKDYEKYPITELTGGKKQTLRNFNQMQKKITKKRKLKLKIKKSIKKKSTIKKKYYTKRQRLY